MQTYFQSHSKQRAKRLHLFHTLDHDIEEEAARLKRIHQQPHLFGAERAPDEQRPAGYHTVRFDGRELPSGLYFYRIETDSFTTTKKMLIVR